jgi:cell shape-determining protein MreC
MIRLIKHKKNYFFENGRTILILLALLVLLVTIFSFLGNFVNFALGPFAKVGGYLYEKASFLPSMFGDKKGILDENKRLKSEVERLNLSLSDFEATMNENEMLRRELGVKPEGNLIPAIIISRPPQVPFDTIFIDRGSVDGINVRDLVYASRKNVIGRIEKVQRSVSVAVLYSYSGFGQNAFVSRTNTLIQIEGRGGGNIEAKTPIDLDIIEGDMISAEFSLGANIAVVESVEEDKVLGFKNVIMSLSANPSSLRMVFIRKADSLPE